MNKIVKFLTDFDKKKFLYDLLKSTIYSIISSIILSIILSIIATASNYYRDININFYYIIPILIIIIFFLIRYFRKKNEIKTCLKNFYYIFNKPTELPNYMDFFLKYWGQFKDEIPKVDYNKNGPEFLLKNWIDFLKEKKKNNANLFLSFTKEELYYIYLISEHIFSQTELVNGSQKHFMGTNFDLWNKMLFPTLNVKNHVQDANRIINNVYYNKNNNENIKYIDFGSGILSSLYYLMSKNDKMIVKYLGIDINKNFCDISNSLLNAEFINEQVKSDFHKYYLGENAPISLKNSLNNPFWENKHRIKKLYNNQFVIKEDINDRKIHKKLLAEYREKIDLITANYCLHHIPNPTLIINSILDKSIFNIWGENINKWPQILKETIVSYLYKKNKKNILFNSLQEYSNGKKRRFEMKEILSEYIENDRKVFFSFISKLLNKGGMFFLSDPDGFSKWNQKEIYDNDWSHAIAHFSNLKNDIILMENIDKPLKFYKAYIQVLTKNDDLLEIELTRKEIINCSFSNKLKNLNDYHLGYIVSFIKK